MEEPLSAGSLPRESDTPEPNPPADLAQARALIAELQAQRDALQRENQQLREARQQLTASEARLNAAEAVAQLGSYELDVASGALHFSDGLCRLFGEEPGSFAPSLAWLDARSDPDDAATVRRVLAEAIAHGQPYQYTRRIRRADGQWRRLESHGRVVVDAAGQALRLEGVVQDQTERQHAEQALLASEEQLRLFALASLNPVYKMSADWRQMYHLAGQRVMAATPATTAAWLRASIPADDQAEVTEAIEHAIRTKSIFELEHRVFLADGSVGWVHSRAIPVLDAQGELLEWLGTGSDITARKWAEQHWHTAAQQLQATLDSSFYSVQAFEAVRDEQGRIIDFTWIFTNKAWTSQHGEVVGKRLLTQNPGVIESGLFALFVQVTETGQPVDHEVYYGYEQFDGWFHQTLVQLGDGFVMNTEDISARKQAEQDLQASRELLQATIDSSLDMIQVFEAVRDAAGAIVDFRWVLNNAVAQRAYGDVIGQRLLEHNPGVVEVGIFDTFRQVVETGRPDQSERHYVHEQFDGWFLQSTVRLNDGVATTTVGLTARKLAEQENLLLKEEMTRQATERYQTLFGAIDQAYCTIENRYDAQGRAVDYRFLDVSASFERETGIRNGAGRWMRDIAPDQDEFWFDAYGRVGRTRQPERFEHYSTPLGRWWSVYAFPIDEPALHRIGVLFNDVTARKQQEQRQQYLLQLSDALRPLAEAAAMQEATAHTALAFFRAERCYYGEIADGQCLIRRDASRVGLPSVAGTYELATMPIFQAVVAAGRPFVVEDVRTTDLVDENLRQLCLQLQVVSFVDVPVIKDGQAVGVLCVVQSTPRRWTTLEIELAAETAERTWAAVARARVEEALRLSEARLRGLITNLPGAAVFVVDADLRYQVAEGEALTAAGFAPADLLGRTVAEAMPPELVAAYETYYRQALAGHGFSVEHTAHGRTFVSRGVPLPGPAAVLVVSYDITDRKRAEEALRQSEEQFRTVANLVPDLLWRSNAQSETTWYNQRWYEYTGQDPASADYGWTAAIHPDDREASTRRYHAAVVRGEELRQEHRIRSATGEYRWFQVQARPIRNAHGEVAEWLGVATDIHYHKLAAEAAAANKAWLEQEVASRTRELQESKDLQEAVFRTVRHAITVFESVRDEERHIVDFKYILSNGVADRHLGRSTVGQTLRTTTPGYADEDNFRRMVQVVQTGRPTDAILYFTYGNQPVYLHTQYYPFRDGLVLVHENITERRRDELALQEHRELLQSIFDTSLFGMSVLHAERDEAGVIQDFRIVLVNQELERETGRTDLVGKRYAEEFPGIRPAGLFALLVRAVETGEPQQTEYFYPYEGFDKWFSCMFVKRDDGVVATNLDITARKQAEEAQRQNLSLLQQAEDVARMGSWEYDLTAGVLHWSPGMYRRLLGAPADATIEPEIYQRLAVDEDKPAAERLVAGLRTGQVPLGETLRLRVGEAVVTLKIKAQVLPNTEGQPRKLLGVDLDVSELQRLEAENLRMRLQQQQDLFNAVLAAQEEERQRIAEGLHNGLGQLLYATKLQLDQLAPTGPASSVWRRASELLVDAIRQTRALSHELVPMVLNEYGLEAAVQDICRKLSTKYLRFECHLNLEDLPAPLPQPLQVALFRMGQELAQNVVKHAQATEASLALEAVPGYVLLRAEDNGVGFPAERQGAGLGLRSIRDRVELLGGHMETGSSAAVGTFVRIRIPLPTA